jgi:MFS transporter, DHA2 family, metal-tetracycline-proton antiporter
MVLLPGTRADPPPLARAGRGVGLWLGGLYGPATFGVAATAVALPTMTMALGQPAGRMVWLLTGYALALGVGTAVAGRLCDALGIRLTLWAGAGLLAVGAAVCLVGATLPVLVVGRVGLAAGSGAMITCAVSLAANIDVGRRPRAVGHLGAVMAACSATATLAGGLAAHIGAWRLALVLPTLSLAMVPACLGLAPPSPAVRRPVDPVGALLLTGAAVGVLTLIQAHSLQLSLSLVAALAVLCPAAVAALALRRRSDGFIPRVLATNRPFLRLCVIGAGAYAGLFATMAAVPPLLAARYGWSALTIGAWLLPGAVLGAVAARAASRHRHGPGVVAGTTAGLAAALVAAAVLDGPVPLLNAAALGFAAAAATQVVLAGRLTAAVPAGFRGAGTGLLMLAEFVGGAAGAAAATALSGPLGVARALAVVAAFPTVSTALALHARRADGLLARNRQTRATAQPVGAGE